MISYESDGVTLRGVDDKGVAFTIGPFDPGYWDTLKVMQSQREAIITNTQAQSKYLTDLHTYQGQLDAGRLGLPNSATLPEKPKMVVVSDKGVVTNVDFEPPLPDPIRPNIVQGSPILSGSGGNTTGTDTLSKKLDVLTSLLMQLIQKISAK